MHSRTSSALPIVRPSGTSICVIRAATRRPERSASATSASANARASSSRDHERTAARLHVEHEGIDALGDLLAQDRGADQRQALDGRGHVAQRVERAVRRGHLVGLADERTSEIRDLRAELVEREAGPEAADAFELVERAAGVSEPAARHHRHRHTEGSDDGRDDQRGLVADAARAVLVDLDALDRGQVDTHPGLHHRIGQPGRLLGRHAAAATRPSATPTTGSQAPSHRSRRRPSSRSVRGSANCRRAWRE